MIRKEGSGYAVYSEKGRRLSRVLDSYKAAASRLREIEFWKRQGSGHDSNDSKKSSS